MSVRRGDVLHNATTGQTLTARWVIEHRDGYIIWSSDPVPCSWHVLDGWAVVSDVPSR